MKRKEKGAKQTSVRTLHSKRTDLVPERNQVNRPTLADAGIDKKLSSRAQNLVAVPAEKFEGMLGKRRGRAELRNQVIKTSVLQCLRGTPDHAPCPRGVRPIAPPDPAQHDTALAGDLSHGLKAGRPSRDRHHVPPGQDIPSPVPA